MTTPASDNFNFFYFFETIFLLLTLSFLKEITIMIKFIEEFILLSNSLIRFFRNSAYKIVKMFFFFNVFLLTTGRH